MKPKSIYRRILKVSIVLAETTESGKLFHIGAILFVKLNLRISKCMGNWPVYTKSMIPQIRPIYLLSACLPGQLVTVESYIPVKIVYASIISPLSRLYFNVGQM